MHQPWVTFLDGHLLQVVEELSLIAQALTNAFLVRSGLDLQRHLKRHGFTLVEQARQAQHLRPIAAALLGAEFQAKRGDVAAGDALQAL